MPGWRNMETDPPPTDRLIWAYLYQTEIRLLRYMDSEERTDTYALVSDHNEPWDPAWVQVDDTGEEWEPKWWLPFDALPTPPP